MDKKMLNTTCDFSLADGSTVKLTLAFYKLYQLRSKNESLYKRYNKIMQRTGGNSFDVLDMITVLYVAYVCANLEAENLHSEEKFMELCGSDLYSVGKTVTALTRPKN